MLKKMLAIMFLGFLFLVPGCGGDGGGVAIEEGTDMTEYDSKRPADYDITKDPNSSSYTGD